MKPVSFRLKRSWEMKKSFLLISAIGILFYTLTLFGCSAERSDIDGTGIIEVREVEVAARQAGTLLELNVEEGEEVQVDQVLARTDSEVQELQLQQALAGRDQAAAQLELLRAGPHPKDIESGAAQLAQASHQLDLARKEWKRIQVLFAENSIPKTRYDSGLANYRIRQAQKAGAKAALEKLENLARPMELSSAQAGLRQAEQQVALARRRVDDCKVTAPISGVISELYYEEGELVPAGRALAKVRDPGKVYLTVYVSEPLLAEIKIGSSAEVYVDGLPDTAFKGRISHINREAEFTPKNVQTKEQRVKLVYAVKIDVESSDGVLKPGMPADVNLQLSSEEQG
jgi:HlyD family secretion protein